MKSILFDAGQNPEFPCLSPLALLREMEEFVKRISEYEFLKQDVKDGYHDSSEFISTVRIEYMNRLDREVRDSIGIYDSGQWEDFLKKYVGQISLVLKKEKQKNSMTGRMEDPDFALIAEFEKIVEAPNDSAERDIFRQNIISQIGVWSLDHPKEAVVYARVFPDFWKKLEKHYFESQKSLLSKMSDALLVYATNEHDPHSEGAILAQQTVLNMKSKYGYCDLCAKGDPPADPGRLAPPGTPGGSQSGRPVRPASALLPLAQSGPRPGHPLCQNPGDHQARRKAPHPSRRNLPPDLGACADRRIPRPAASIACHNPLSD